MRPGVGKTLLAKAIAKSLHCRFTRLQFTPDMLPSDILGSSVYLGNLGDFEFRKGPIFTNVLLADEINRTTPRTQSALLEAMNEGQVSVEGRTYLLDPPFFVLATQNPHEYEGTYPLPENQLDRFTVCTDIGYPGPGARDADPRIAPVRRDGRPFESRAHDRPASATSIRPPAKSRSIPSINSYMLDIIAATRTHEELELGVSTRGAIVLFRTVQCQAMLENRKFAIPDDVKRLAVPVLRAPHRLPRPRPGGTARPRHGPSSGRSSKRRPFPRNRAQIPGRPLCPHADRLRSNRWLIRWLGSIRPVKLPVCPRIAHGESGPPAEPVV